MLHHGGHQPGKHGKVGQFESDVKCVLACGSKQCNQQPTQDKHKFKYVNGDFKKVGNVSERLSKYLEKSGSLMRA